MWIAAHRPRPARLLCTTTLRCARTTITSYLTQLTNLAPTRSLLHLIAEALVWLHEALGEDEPCGSIKDVLRSGHLLGRLADVVGTFRSCAVPGTTAELREPMENVRAFLDACEDLNLDRSRLFSAIDVLAGRRSRLVAQTLADFAAACVEAGLQVCTFLHFSRGDLEQSHI